MKALFSAVLVSAVLAVLALTLAVPALADRDRGFQDARRDPGNFYDRRNWHVPRYNIRQNYHSAPLRIYHGPRHYYPGRAYPGYSYRGQSYPRPGYRGHGYRGHHPVIQHHYHDSGYLGGIYLLNEILHHDKHHRPRR